MSNKLSYVHFVFSLHKYLLFFQSDKWIRDVFLYNDMFQDTSEEDLQFAAETCQGKEH